MSWRERLVREPGLTDLNRWPQIDRATLPRKHRKGFLTNQRIVAQMLKGARGCVVAESLGLTKGYVSQVMSRCLGGDLEQSAALTPALIPYHRLTAPTRRAALPSLSECSGTMGAFNALLEALPDVKATVDNKILADHKRTTFSERLTPSGLHQSFLQLLTEANWPRDRYPFTSDSQGSESLRRYFRHRQTELQTPKPGKHPITDLEASISRHRALATVQIDEHAMDLVCNVAIEFNDELIELRLQRCSLLLAIDVATECILGFELRPSRAPNQDDILALFDRCLTPRPTPDILTPGFDQLVFAATPAELVPAWPLCIGTVQFDNAWIHHSHSVEDFLSKTMGATLSFGLPGQPKTRWLVEHVFDYLERKLGHRFDSTTGSHPQDPKRESARNVKRVPALSYHSLVEAIHLVISAFNYRSRPHLAGMSPIALFQRHLKQHWVPWTPGGVDFGWQLFQSSKVLTIHRLAREQRGPYVQFCYCRYSGDGLLTLSPKDTQVVVQVDRRDIRTLSASTLDGRPLGRLVPPRSWRRFAHTQATRQFLFKQHRGHLDRNVDPITGYFLDLLSQTSTPRIAAHILAVYQEITWGGQAQLLVGDAAKDAIRTQEQTVPEDCSLGKIVRDGFARTNFMWSPSNHGGAGRF